MVIRVINSWDGNDSTIPHATVQLLKVTRIELYESLIGLKKLIRSTVIYRVEIVFKKIMCT